MGQQNGDRCQRFWPTYSMVVIVEGNRKGRGKRKGKGKRKGGGRKEKGKWEEKKP